MKNLSARSASHQRYLRVHVVYPRRVCFQSHGGVPSRVPLCRRSHVLRFVVSIHTSHLHGHTPVFSWVFIPGYSLCFFPSVLYLQGVPSGEFIILMHRVYKYYKHLKPPLLFFCYIPHGCNMCALRAQSNFSRRSKSGIEKSKIKVSGGLPPREKDGCLRMGCRREEAACADLLQQRDFLIRGVRGNSSSYGIYLNYSLMKHPFEH